MFMYGCVCVFLWVMVGMYEAKGEREASMAWGRSRWSSVPCSPLAVV